jgi:hypothetical protein
MSRPWLLAPLFAVALSAACVGDIGDPSETNGEAEGPICAEGVTQPGRSPIRRLTRHEYNNTVRDLFGDDSKPANSFPAEEESLGFGNNADALSVTPVLAEKYMSTAEAVAQRATKNPGALSGCSATDPESVRNACVRGFISRIGRRVLRRQVTLAEVDELYAIYESAYTIYASTRDPRQLPFQQGLSMVLESLLQSPAFLYRVELGSSVGVPPNGGLAAADPDEDDDAVPLTSWEMASRLSYFLWGTTPDDALLDAAEQNQLMTKEQVLAEAERMLDDPKARDAVGAFHQEWLDYDRVQNITKDMALYPEWSPAIGAAMREEMRVFIDHVVFDGEGDFRTLMTAPYTFASPELAKLYGATLEGDDSGLYRVDFPAGQHAGLLTMGAILSYYAHTNQTSPVHRGKLVRETFLCDVLLPPPNNVAFEVPEPDESSTARERFSAHSADASCSGCHRLMDPIGFGFEQFDTLGRFRTTENGAAIDASGSIVASDVDGPFNGVSELAEKLADSDEVKSCYAKMWFRYAYGRAEASEDACAVDQIETAFSKSNGSVKALLLSLTQTDTFMFRRRGPT